MLSMRHCLIPRHNLALPQATSSSFANILHLYSRTRSRISPRMSLLCDHGFANSYIPLARKFKTLSLASAIPAMTLLNSSSCCVTSLFPFANPRTKTTPSCTSRKKKPSNSESLRQNGQPPSVFQGCSSPRRSRRKTKNYRCL